MSNMVKVQRANVILQISAEDQDRYFAQGYNILDEQGKIIKKSIPQDVGELRAAYTEATAEVEKLKAEIEQLKKQLQEEEQKADDTEAVQIKESKPRKKSVKAEE